MVIGGAAWGFVSVSGGVYLYGGQRDRQRPADGQTMSLGVCELAAGKQALTIMNVPAVSARLCVGWWMVW